MGEARGGPEGVWTASSSTAEKVGPWRGWGSQRESRPGFAPHKGDPLPCSLSRGEGPQVQRSLDHSWKPGAFPGPGGGARGVFAPPNPVWVVRSHQLPGPSPRSSGQSLGKVGNHKGCKDPISLLWLKLSSSSFAIADITRSLFYKCRGPWIEQYPILPSRGGPGSRTSSRTSSLEPSHSSGGPAATYPHLGISRKNNF